MAETKNNDERFPEVKPTKPGNDTAYIAPIIGKLGYDTRRPWLFGLGTSPNNGVDFHVFLSFDGLNFDDNDINKIWNGGTADKVKKEVDSATAEIPAAVSAANSAVSAAESAVAASKVNSDAIVAQSEAISEAKSAMDSATAEIQQTAANAVSDAAKIQADVAQVQSEVDTAKAATSASVEALKSDVSAAKQDLSDVHDSLDKAQSAIEQDLANVHDSLTKAQAAAEENQKAIDDSIAKINANVDATNQDIAGVRKDLAKAQSDIAANQKSINDNVAKVNADITQDRKDIASVQQANANTAKQLDTYSKQAVEQGKTIKTIQDKQDGFTATLADVQGNVSQVSDKVDGLSASLKDAQGNVASVKAQADQLSATLTDHAKSIATLTASAKELSSTLEDADGRLSKVEQTAKTNSSTLSDVQGDLSQVKQDATTLTATLKDTQGNISTLQQKADSVSAQLASAQGDITTLQTGVDGIKATLASHDKTIHTLQLDSKSLKDSMADAQGDISTLQKSATSLDSEMKDHAGRLSKVEQSATTQATTLSDLQGNLSQVKQQADGLVTTLKDAQGDITQIQQKADGTLEQLKSAQGDIASLQTDVTGIKATLISHEGDIHTLQADSKSLKDDMQDAQGNISSLKKSATDLTSEMSSQDGRLSKVEQTAKEHTSTIGDLGDKLSNLKVGGRNLVQNTGQDIVLDDTANAKENGWYFATISLTQQPKAGDQLTVSAEGTLTGKGDLSAYQIDLYNANTTDKRSNDAYLAPGKRSSATLTVNNLTGSGDTVLLIYAGKWGDTEGKRLVLHHLKVELGNTATDWTPAPEDMATVTQVKQTTDGITTTLKNAQGDIDQIRQQANGTSEQLSNVQGDVTNIQKDVDGLKQTTADNAGDIHTLQSDSKTLKDDMQDAQGDISTLKKTSTDVTSELKDHAGRISKTEQTAATLTNEFADQQGHLNRVEQTAQGTQQTVANQQGQINNIKTDAAGIHETLTGQGNQIANINVTLSGLNTKYEGVSGDLGKLKGQVTTNSTQITQNKKEIDLKADQSTVDNLSGEVSQNKAQLKVQADQISSKVSSEDFKTLDNKVNNLQVGGRNLIRHGDANEAGKNLWPNTVVQTHPFYMNGTKNLFLLKTSQKAEFTSENEGWFPVKSGKQYTLSFVGFMGDNVVNYDVWILGRKIGSKGTYDKVYFAINANILSPAHADKVIKTFVMPADWNGYEAHIRFDNNGSKDGKDAYFFFNEVKLEEGNVATDYTSAPEDTIASIEKNSTAIDQTNQKISLKADQTTVDKIKNTATQNSSRLDVMAGEIKSKVTSTDVNNIVNGKDYATTSTVQSLITQKAGTINESITNLDAKYSAKDGVNLVRASSFHNVTLDDLKNSGWSLDKAWINKNGGSNKQGSIVIDATSITTGVEDITQTIPLEPDTDYTLSFHLLYAGVASGKSFSAWSYVVEEDSNGKAVSPYVDNNHPMFNSDDRKLNTRTFHTSKNTHQGVLYLRAMPGTKVELEEVKLERGSVATPWTPAPSDNATVTQLQSITASVDGVQSNVTNLKNDTSSRITQLSNTFQSKIGDAQIAINDLKDKTLWKSTDNIDLNSAVSQQKIFVKGGSNLPPGDYWWYVQVESGYDSRIVQYAVSDRDNIHYSRQYDGSKWSAWSQGATESEITQLRDDINLRVVKKGDLLSQINIDAGHTLIQSNKIYLAAGNVVFSDNAFIPSAAIKNLDASKLTFYGPYNTYATIGSSVKQYDQDKLKSTINLQYNGGVEVHASNELGSILTMHDDTIRLAVKSQVYGSGSGLPVDKQYSGVWFGKNYTLMNSVDSEGRTTGISIGSGGSVNGQYRFVLYDDSKDIQPSYGVKINTQRFNVDAGSTSLYMGPTRIEIRANDYTTLHGNDKAWLEGGHAQVYLHDGVVEMHNLVDGSAAGLHVTVQGWATFSGYVEAMGWTTKSTLSSKTRIEPLNTSDALDKITSTDLTTYQYKDEVSAGSTKRHAGPIIDDVHDVAQYRTPDAFISENRQGRSDADIIGYLMGAVQELKKQLDKVKEQVNNG